MYSLMTPRSNTSDCPIESLGGSVSSAAAVLARGASLYCGSTRYRGAGPEGDGMPGYRELGWSSGSGWVRETSRVDYGRGSLDSLLVEAARRLQGAEARVAEAQAAFLAAIYDGWVHDDLGFSSFGDMAREALK